MKIESLKLCGIGPFRSEIEVPFSELDSIVSISGPNGIGKTFLLECVPGALYNFWPFRMYEQSKSVYDFMFPGVSAYIEMKFEINGRRFRIVRNYTLEGTWDGDEFKEKNKNQTAYIYEWDGFEWTAVAEKVNEVKDFVENEICPKQLFLASVFNSQNSAGDLVGVSKVERKAIFASLIGLDPLQEKSEFFKTRASSISALVDEERTAIRIHESMIVDKELTEANIGVFESSIKTKADEIESLRKSRDAHITNKERSERDKELRSTLFAELKILKERRTELEQRIQKLTDFKLEVSTLESKRVANETLKVVLKEIEKKYDGLKGLERTDDIQKEIDALSEQFQKINNEFMESRNRIQNEEKKIAKLYAVNENEIAKYETKLDSTKILDELNCDKNCKYVSVALENQNLLKEIDGEGLYLKRNVYKDQIDQCERNLKEKYSTEKFKEITREIEDRRERLKKELEDERKKKVEIQKLENEIKSKRNIIESFEMSGALEKIARLKDADERLKELLREKRDLNDEIVTKNEQATSELDINNYDELIKMVEFNIERREKDQNSTREHIAKLKEQLRQSAMATLKINIIKDRITKLENLQKNYSVLSEAFGRNGMQALIIDSEKYQFLEIARELFSILSGGKMALQFETQKTLKKGGEKKEDFELYLIIDGVKRELLQCSQGQQDLGRIVMRATLGIYYAQKTGGMMKTYFLDETTGSLDDMNRESYLKFLAYLNNHFQQIIVITHQDLGRVIPCRIEIDERRQIRISN